MARLNREGVTDRAAPWTAPVAVRAQARSAPGAVTAGAGTLTALAAVVLLTLTGCASKSTGPEDTDDSPHYKLRTGPANIIYNLNTAYEWMDAEEYLDCFAEDFEFTLNPDDLGNPDNPLPESWGKQEERDIHEAMFSDATNVGHVDLTLTNVSVDFDAGADPYDTSDDRYTYREGTDLRVTIGELIFLANADQQFVFRVDADETGPNGQTLWEIIEWHDLQCGRHESSWGAIKSMYW